MDDNFKWVLPNSLILVKDSPESFLLEYSDPRMQDLVYQMLN